MSRKTKLYWKLAGLSLLFLLVLGLGILWIRGGGNMFSFGGEAVWQARFADVESVDCRLSDCAVEVRTWDQPEVEVTCYRWGLGGSAPEARMEGGVLIVEQPGLGLHIGGGKVVVQAPAGALLSYRLKTVSGSLSLDAPCTDAVLKTTSGSVQVHQAGAALQAETVSGSIRVFAPFDRQDLNTTSGSIRAVADGETTEIRANTVSGGIRLRLEGVSGYTLEHHTTSGSVKDTYHDVGYDQSGTARWGDEGLFLHASTVSGSIRLEDWED